MGPALRAGGRKSHTGSNPVLAMKLVDLSKPHRQDIGDLKGNQDKMSGSTDTPFVNTQLFTITLRLKIFWPKGVAGSNPA